MLSSSNVSEKEVSSIVLRGWLLRQRIQSIYSFYLLRKYQAKCNDDQRSGHNSHKNYSGKFFQVCRSCRFNKIWVWPSIFLLKQYYALFLCLYSLLFELKLKVEECSLEVFLDLKMQWVIQTYLPESSELSKQRVISCVCQQRSISKGLRYLDLLVIMMNKTKLV